MVDLLVVGSNIFCEYFNFFGFKNSDEKGLTNLFRLPDPAQVFVIFEKDALSYELIKKINAKGSLSLELSFDQNLDLIRNVIFETVGIKLNDREDS
jgi:hypothetical protein